MGCWRRMSLRADWPLTGRDDELRLVLDTLGGARASVVLAGAAGVGKTRLMRELLASLEATGREVNLAVATMAASKIPFGALIALLPELAEGQLEHLALAQRLYDRLADDGESVVAIDDAHLLDDFSAAIVHQLAVRDATTLVLTLRTGERSPDPIASMVKDGYAQRFELQPLSREETERLVTSGLGVVATRTLLRLFEVTRGNPLYLREIVFGAIDSGSMRLEAGVWTWGAEATPSPLLHDVVSSRLGELDNPEQRALEILALGEPLELEVFDALASTEIVAELERKGLVVEARREQGTEVRLVHPIYAEVLRAQVAPRDAQAARRSLVEIWERSTVRRPDDVLRMAVVHLESGIHDRPSLLCEGSAQALAATDWELAHRLAAAAYSASASAESAFALAQANASLGRFEECAKIGRPFLAAGIGDRTHSELARTVAWALYAGLDRPDEADRVYLRAAEASTDEAMRQRLLAGRTNLLACIGRGGEALAINLKALESPELEAVAIAQHVSVAGRILALTGKTTDAIALIDKHMPAILSISEGNAGVLTETFTARLVALAFAGPVAEGLAFVEPLYELTVQLGNDAGRIGAASGLAALYTLAGRPRTACEFADVVLSLWKSRGHHEARDWIAAFYAESLALLGRVDEAAEKSMDAQSIWSHSPRYFQPEIKRTGAWVLAARGELSHARQLALEAAAEAQRSESLMLELMARYDAVRLGVVEECSAVRTLAADAQGELVRAIGLHAAGVEADDPKVLDTAAASLEAAGRVLCAAEAAAQAAAAYERGGLRGSAAAAAERSRRLAERCEGAMTPILIAGARPDPLTPREREVALLASQGLSNKAIAERLVTSARTVEGHLYQVYAKLGVSGRADLASLQEPTGRGKSPA